MMPLYAQIERILTARTATLELPEERPVADIVRALELEGCRVVLLDRAPVFDKETLLHAIYQGCGFPAYFGFNWDALSDALVEKVGEESRPLVLIFQDFDLLGTRAPEVAKTFLDIVDEVGELTRENPIRLVCLNRGRGA
jgi:RNAse (barnase) inhibitor barstar